MISSRHDARAAGPLSSRPATKPPRHVVAFVAFAAVSAVALLALSLVAVGRCSLAVPLSSPFADRPAPPAPPSSRRDRRPLDGYWWPSAEDGGLLRRIHAAQNPPDCSAAKFLVWRSMRTAADDTRGLTAWAHAGSMHLLHALTGGDRFAEGGSRVLITDEEPWPMARGCEWGPETRECYFKPLTWCKLSDAVGGGSSVQLAMNGDEYDRETRTVYTSPTDIWFRNTKLKYSWTNLPGGNGDHSEMFLVAAELAYYFRPQKWLRDEIDKRIRRSIPADLDPARTVGVPIRRSDKCMGHKLEGSAAGELDCPPLEKYLAGVKSFVEFDPLVENVIVTSEDRSACDAFLRMLRRELPGLRAVLNVGDVQQGTGSGSKLESYVEGSANADVVASALTSMHLHLRARYFVVTTKSTWTSTIAVMARVYGFASEVFVYDIGPNTNIYSGLARKGG